MPRKYVLKTRKFKNYKINGALDNSKVVSKDGSNKFNLDELQTKSADMLMEFHTKSQQLITLRSQVITILKAMTRVNEDIGLLVAKKNNNIEQIEFFAKKVDSRRHGMFRVKNITNKN